MAKRFEDGKAFVGRWVIASMSQFDLDYIHEEGEGRKAGGAGQKARERSPRSGEPPVRGCRRLAGG